MCLGLWHASILSHKAERSFSALSYNRATISEKTLARLAVHYTEAEKLKDEEVAVL